MRHKRLQKSGILCLSLLLGITMLMTGCGRRRDDQMQNAENNSPAHTSSDAENINRISPTSEIAELEDGFSAVRYDGSVTELTVRFGDSGDSFVMHLEDNSTAAAIAGYVGTAEWRLPVYSYDESDVMEYYDIPSRYEIPDNSETVTEAHAGDVFYSDPNRIVLYYHDAEINEQYTRIGTFDATEEFVDAVENNPVLEGWGNQIVVISDGE